MQCPNCTLPSATASQSVQSVTIAPSLCLQHLRACSVTTAPSLCPQPSTLCRVSQSHLDLLGSFQFCAKCRNCTLPLWATFSSLQSVKIALCLHVWLQSCTCHREEFYPPPPTSMELAYGLTGLAAVHRKRQGVYLHLFGPQCQSLSPCFLTSMHKVEPKLDQSRYDLLKQNQLSVCTPLTRMNAKLFNISEYIPTIPLGEDHHVDLLHTEDHGHLHEDKQHSEDGSFLLGFPQLDNSQPFTSFLQSGPSAHFGHSCRWRLKSSADINFIAHYV